MNKKTVFALVILIANAGIFVTTDTVGDAVRAR